MITIEPTTQIPFTVPLSDNAIDNVSATVLAQKYGYGPKHLRRMQRENTLPWRQARQEVLLTLNATLNLEALTVPRTAFEVDVVAPAAAAQIPAPTGPPVIGEFQNEHRFLSNFWPYDGVDLSRTAEHDYQGAKTLIVEEKAAIMAAEKPHAAKLLGDVATVREDWEAHRLDAMKMALETKFKIPALAQQLLDTGSAVLIEGNHWCDTFWGCCTCEIHQGAGMNWLGLLLMETRNTLRGHVDITTVPK